MKRVGLMYHKSKQGQASVIDFTVAFIVFTAIFVVDYYLWSQVEAKIANNEDEHYFKTSVYNAVESLVKTMGQPYNWEINMSSALSIGLAIKDNWLSNDKLSALSDADYNETSSRVLSTGEYQITIIDSDNNEVYSTGLEPQGQTVRVDRLVRINDSYYTLIFRGWKA